MEGFCSLADADRVVWFLEDYETIPTTGVRVDTSTRERERERETVYVCVSLSVCHPS
jgi:hypothetical protein